MIVLNTNGNTFIINGTSLPTNASLGSVTGSLIAVSGNGTVKVGP